MNHERLKTLLEQYPDDEYFFLARNYLGLVESPFHKEHITERLIGFFALEENRDRMLALIDSLDQTIITALLFSGGLLFEQLAVLLEEFEPYGKLLLRVANLRERMVVVATDKTLLLNPILEERLSELACLSPLFGPEERRIHAHPFSYRELLQAILTLAERPSRSFFRKEYEALFPTMRGMDLPLIFETVRTSFVKLGIISEDTRRRVDWQRAHDLFQLEEPQLKAMMLGIRLDGESDGARGAFCTDLVLLLEDVGTFSTSGLKRLGDLLAFRHHVDHEDLVSALIGLGLLVRTKGGYNHLTYTLSEPASSFIVDSDYSVSYLGSLAADSLLVRFAALETLDRTRLWRITEERLRYALDEGVGYEEIRNYLETHMDGTLNAALLKSLDLIAERSRQIRIYDGLVLQTDERVGRIADRLPTLQEHILARLSSTIFLMKRSSERIWRQILTQAGLSLGSTGGEPAQASEADPRELPAIGRPQEFALPVRIGRKVTLPPVKLDENLREAIRRKIYPKEVEEDLLERFEERLIITSSQIAPQILHTRIEAGGFDYQGKISLAKQAASKEGTVVQLFMGGGEELMALALELTYTPNKEALFKVAILPQMEMRVIPLSKIFLLRRIKMLFL
ncbi:MAG: hypothetical protein GX911_00835 [Spirochaetales bacterium]|nr:hypothetical protein [Spirochaetales bacterium]